MKLLKFWRQFCLFLCNHVQNGNQSHEWLGKVPKSKSCILFCSFPQCVWSVVCVCLFVSWPNGTRSGTIVWEGYPPWGLKQWEDIPHTHTCTLFPVKLRSCRRCLQGVWTSWRSLWKPPYRCGSVSIWQDCVEKLGTYLQEKRSAHCRLLLCSLAKPFPVFTRKLPRPLGLVWCVCFCFSAVWMTTEVIRGHWCFMTDETAFESWGCLNYSQCFHQTGLTQVQELYPHR